jgi:hypothetical protein
MNIFFYEMEQLKHWLGIEPNTFGVAAGNNNHCTIQVSANIVIKNWDYRNLEGFKSINWAPWSILMDNDLKNLKFSLKNWQFVHFLAYILFRYYEKNSSFFNSFVDSDVFLFTMTRSVQFLSVFAVCELKLSIQDWYLNGS